LQYYEQCKEAPEDDCENCRISDLEEAKKEERQEMFKRVDKERTVRRKRDIEHQEKVKLFYEERKERKKLEKERISKFPKPLKPPK